MDSSILTTGELGIEGLEAAKAVRVKSEACEGDSVRQKGTKQQAKQVGHRFVVRQGLLQSQRF